MNEDLELRDPIHGYIHLTNIEKSLIDTQEFQRLRRIRQLAGAHLTYPGAPHSRFEHAIGCCHLAGLVGQRLKSKIVGKKEDINRIIEEIRIAALLHDIGHGPFSHIFEEVIDVKENKTHEDMTEKIIKETKIADILKTNSYDLKIISKLSTASCDKKPQYLNDVIGGGLSVDTMDYLLRDSHFTGVEYGKVDVHRVIDSMEIINDKLALDKAALYAFEALAIGRYEMFRAVYFHRSVRAGEVMLIKAMQLADKELNLTKINQLDEYMKLTDEIILNNLTNLDAQGKSHLKLAKSLAIDYTNRKLIKCVYEKVGQGNDRIIKNIFTQKKIREEITNELANIADVDYDSIYLDVSATPSVPYTSKRQNLTSLTLVSNSSIGKTYEIKPISELPLLKEISGFMDIIRIYTDEQHREKVEKAVDKLFKNKDFN